MEARPDVARRGKKLPVFLRGGEGEQLAGAARTEAHRLIVACGLYLGLRVSELCHLRVEDLDLSQATALVRQGKGNKDRCLPIPGRLLAPLHQWVGPRTSGWLFPSPRDPSRRLSPRAVQRLVGRLAGRAGIARPVTPHKLRHTYATRLLEAGATIREVQELLGHSSVATTEIYTHCTPDRLRSAVERL